MAGALAYLDSSALIKLVLEEREAAALRAELERWPTLVGSRLLRTETLRACRRYGEDFARDAEAALTPVTLLPLDDALLEFAARLEPPPLRTLDAVHLATALSLGDDIGALITYDERLGDAARQAGLRILAPA